MWMLQDLANNLPENWIVYQCIATADGTTALTSPATTPCAR